MKYPLRGILLLGQKLAAFVRDHRPLGLAHNLESILPQLPF
jgi:hypothetical protein